jgi:hypothetical protein
MTDRRRGRFGRAENSASKNAFRSDGRQPRPQALDILFGSKHGNGAPC